MPILPWVNRRGWSVHSNRRHYPPLLKRNTHVHMCMENYQKQKQALRPWTLHIYQEQMAKLTSTYFIRWEMNFCQKQLKSKHTHMLFTWNGPPLIECFLFQIVIGNLILIKVFRAQAYIPSFKEKHAKTLTDTNLKQPLELIYKNVYNTEIHGEVTYKVVGISLYKRLHINMGTTKCFTKKWKMHDLLRSWNSGLFPFLFQFGNEPREDLRHAR